MTRRRALRRFWWLAAGSPLLRAQERVTAGPQPLPDRAAPLDELVNVFEVEEVARQRLSRAVYEHIAAGAGGGATLRRNREVFDRITFRPRVLVNVEEMDLTVDLFGQKLYTPILVAPTANHRRAHPDGERATAKGAAAAQAVMVASGRSSVPVDQIGAGPFWYQVYAEADAGKLRENVVRAVAAGCRAVCLTLGAPYATPRDVDLHNREPGATRPHELRARYSTDSSWELVERLRGWSKVPVLVKGILSAEEAGAAIERGAAGIVVSNHGGRAVDGVPATIEALPGITDVVKGRVPILIDSGFRRGTDILKALALGARAVLIGRPILWGLAAYGADGVRAVIEMLQTELALAMGLSGKPNLATVDRSLVKIHRR